MADHEHKIHVLGHFIGSTHGKEKVFGDCAISLFSIGPNFSLNPSALTLDSYFNRNNGVERAYTLATTELLAALFPPPTVLLK